MNAATNPFRSECVTALPFVPQGVEWTELWENLEVLRFRGAIVGPCGTGKTTLLEAMVPYLETRGFEVQFWRLDSGARSLPRPFWESSWGEQDALLLDGAEQLSRWQWRALKWKVRLAGTLVVTSHRAGLLPTWLRATTSPALLASLCAQLGVSLAEAEVEKIYRTHNGNMRECLLVLYDSMASLP